MSVLDDIAAADDLATTTVDVPEWGRKVTLKAHSIDTALAFEVAVDEWKTAHGGEAMKPLRVAATYLAFAILGDDGQPLGAPAIETLMRKSRPVIERLFLAAPSMARQVESLSGESSAVPSGASSSV